MLGLRLALDLLQALDRHLPRQLEVRAGRRPEPQHEFPRIDLREQLGADLQAQHPEHQAARHEIDRHRQPAQPDEPAHRPAVDLEEPVEQPGLLLAMAPVCASSRVTLMIGTNMLESKYDEIMANPTAQGQRHEQRPERVGHDERRDEHRQDAEQRQEPRHRRGVARLQHRRGDVRRVLHLHVRVLDRHRRLVDQDADRQRHAAQRHDVDRVARRPQPDQRPQERQRDVGHDDEHAPQIAQEQQDHQPGQARADQPFGGHALDRRHHGGRLVELEVDRDVLGHGVAEQLHRLVDVGHDGQGRSRVFLDDRQIDRILAVDKCVSIGDVDVVLDGRHVAKVDVPLQPERNIAQLLDVDHRRVVGDQRHRVLDVDVPRGDDGVPRRQRIDDLLRRQVVVQKLVRIDIDDDRPHVGAERRDRHRAGDVFLHQRPDDVLRQVAHRPQRGHFALEHQIADRNAAGSPSA